MCKCYAIFFGATKQASKVKDLTGIYVSRITILLSSELYAKMYLKDSM
jgi:hypothetical protein